MHFYTDILGGLALGAAVGAIVPWMHRKEVSLLPTVHAAAFDEPVLPGMTLAVRF